MARLFGKRIRLALAFPLMHFFLCLIAFLLPWATGWEELEAVGDVIAKALAVLDFPVSFAFMILAWFLPEVVEIIGFGVVGTLWWYYLGRKADTWLAGRANEKPKTGLR